MCDGSLYREKRDVNENRTNKCPVNASCIVKRSLLGHLKGRPREDYQLSWPDPHLCIYPKVSSYYAFHEDTNPFTRFSAKCESRGYENIQPHFEPPKDPYETRDPYSETEAITKYLRSKPTCFVIFGKPDLNITKLATMIAESWNCILISPLPLIKHEIERGTEKGEIIANILRMGERLGPEIVMNLIESRLNKRDIFHRGYVVEGLPLISNELMNYSSYPSHSDEQMNVGELAENYMKFFQSSFYRICGAMDKIEKSQDTLSNGTEQQALSPVEKEFKNKICTIHATYEHFIYSQIEDMFTTWPLKPSMIIYAVCPDRDVVRKREEFRIDAITGHTVDTSLLGISKNIEMLFAYDRTDNNDMNISFELYQELMNEERIFDENQRKYLLRRPCDRKANVGKQCELYKDLAMPVIEKWILRHNPQNVIRVDGRSPVSQMFQIVLSRLRTLPVQRVILPRRMLDDATAGFDGESPAVTVSVKEFESKSNEEALQELTNRDTVSPLYPWTLSPWIFRCPVELTKGRTVDGAGKHTVRFINKIFFLSSSEAVNLFLDNPRTFLLPFCPRFTCKIAVFGPMYSGKSNLCRELAQTFKGTIINVKEIEKSFSTDDWDISYDTIIPSALEEKANTVAKKIKEISEEEIDVEIWRDGGYIVDGMFPDEDCWKTIVEDSNIVFEDAVLLFDDLPYEHLLSKWRNIDEGKDTYSQEDMISQSDSEEEESSELMKYLRHIEEFERHWEGIKEKVADTCKTFIACNVGQVVNVSKYVIDRIKDRYTDKSRIMTEEEKEKEKDLVEYMTVAEKTEDGEEPEDEGTTFELDGAEDVRRLGDTSDYCPLALLKYNVLWKGKEDFSAIFMNKIYLLSSETALAEFTSSPQKLSLPFRKPLSAIPAVRVSIIGPIGSGKSTMARAVSREYGLTHIDYYHRFSTFMMDRGMVPTSYRDVIVSPEDLLDEVDLPEDPKDEKYNSDSATIQTFVRRYWKAGGVLPEKMLRECLFAFFEGLYNNHGVILDQFPSCPEDVEAAVKNYTVPEVIIELGCSKDEAFERTVPELLASWQNKLEEKKHEESLRHANKLWRYKRERKIWMQEMLRKSFRERSAEETKDSQDISEESSWFSVSEGKSEDFFTAYINSEEGELKRSELEEIWLEDHPQPVMFTDWEDLETARQRIIEGFDESYEENARKINAVRNSLENETIPYVMVNADRNPQNVLLEVMSILYPYIVKDSSALERPRTTDLETAETLLEYGYYFLSSFARWCPVQLYENKIPLQMFLPLEAERELYPVIHRQYIYFLGSKNACSAFLKSPLKYLEQDSSAPVVPLRLSIIGPPKCGKTSLARRIAKRYGAKVITRGTALRHVLKYFSWTECSRVMESRVRKGDTVPEECLSRTVDMYSIDARSISQGFVLDGFPSSRREYEQLTFLGVAPMIVVDLRANVEFCVECASRDDNETKKPANFSKTFVKHRFINWDIDASSFRAWLKSFSQNVIEIDATKSTWYVWTQADREVCSRYIEIRTYFRESDYDKVHSLKFLSVSPYEFKRRQSQFKSLCPLCLFYDDITNNSGPVPGHQGMVQFREHFYWICPEHVTDFVGNPKKYIPPINTRYPAEDRARALTETVDKEHACWARRLQIGGFCLVTYVDDLPNRRLVPGKPSIGALYKDNVFLFCSEKCREKFLQQYEKYSNVEVKFLRTLEPIHPSTLPDLGFLEQTVAKIITEAANYVSVLRPKIPGLSPSITAAIYIGVYLKTHNTSCTLNESEIYETVSKRLDVREKIIKLATRVTKRKLNPFMKVPIYKSDSVKARRVPVPDARFDYLCEYFKPASKVPAFLNVVDIAGLVKGAAEGQGLGNSFLSHINACDGIFHLCRAFEDDDVTHIEGDVNPVRDLEIISEELRLKDIEFLHGHLEKLEKIVVRGNDKKLKPEYDTLLKVKGVMLDEKRHIRFADWTAVDIEILNKYLFLTSKPVIYLVNLSEKDYIRKKNKWLVKIKEWVDKNDPGAILIPFSGAFENKLIDINEAERAKYLEENKVTSALDKIIVQGYKALQLQYFFTAGHDEVKAWTIQKGTKAPQAAGKIHTDFEKGFIMADVMKFDDFKNEGSEAGVKAAGKYRQQGRNYVVEDGDIIFFKFNAGAGLKDAKKK